MANRKLTISVDFSENEIRNLLRVSVERVLNNAESTANLVLAGAEMSDSLIDSLDCISTDIPLIKGFVTKLVTSAAEAERARRVEG